jgi:hypothetical protein
MGVLRGMLGKEFPPELVFVNLTAEQLEGCIQAAQRPLSPAPQPAAVPSIISTCDRGGESSPWVQGACCGRRMAGFHKLP